jgi:phage/plasmid-associated DNA primase
MFPDWAPYFFALLTLYHKIYRVEGLKIPQEVKDATNDYRKTSDAYAQFMADYFIPDPDESIKLDDAYTIFRDWWSAEFNEKAPPRREFKVYVERKLNQTYGKGTKAGWYGYRIEHPNTPAKGGLELSVDHTIKSLPDPGDSTAITSIPPSSDVTIKKKVPVTPKAKPSS